MRSSAGALPLPDYDKLTIEMLAVRIQCLTSHELHQLLGYEWVHGQREEFVLLLATRLKELASGASPVGVPVVFIPEQSRGSVAKQEPPVIRATGGTVDPEPSL